MFSRYVAHVFPEWLWNSPSRPYYYWYHLLSLLLLLLSNVPFNYVVIYSSRYLNFTVSSIYLPCNVIWAIPSGFIENSNYSLSSWLWRWRKYVSPKSWNLFASRQDVRSEKVCLNARITLNSWLVQHYIFVLRNPCRPAKEFQPFLFCLQLVEASVCSVSLYGQKWEQ